MKRGPCTHCGDRTIYEISEPLIPNYEYANPVHPLTLTAHYGPTGESGLFGAKSERTTVRVEAYVCASCGHAALFAKDLARLEQYAAAGAGNVRKVTR